MCKHQKAYYFTKKFRFLKCSSKNDVVIAIPNLKHQIFDKSNTQAVRCHRNKDNHRLLLTSGPIHTAQEVV